MWAIHLLIFFNFIFTMILWSISICFMYSQTEDEVQWDSVALNQWVSSWKRIYFELTNSKVVLYFEQLK